MKDLILGTLSLIAICLVVIFVMFPSEKTKVEIRNIEVIPESIEHELHQVRKRLQERNVAVAGMEIDISERDRKIQALKMKLKEKSVQVIEVPGMPEKCRNCPKYRLKLGLYVDLVNELELKNDTTEKIVETQKESLAFAGEKISRALDQVQDLKKKLKLIRPPKRRWAVIIGGGLTVTGNLAVGLFAGYIII